jgi:hypothetical protein
MAKIIIFLTGHPRVNGFKRGEFVWSEDRQCYIYQAKEYDETTFNAAFELFYRRYGQMTAYGIKFVPDNSAPPVTVSELPPDEGVPDDTLISSAESVLERLAPHRLKKKPGPKPVEVPA